MNEMAKRGARRLEERAVASLKPHARNARTHAPAQLKKLEASIRCSRERTIVQRVVRIRPPAPPTGLQVSR